ncbi:hypothetical protein [Chryseobacterium koreense]
MTENYRQFYEMLLKADQKLKEFGRFKLQPGTEEITMKIEKNGKTELKKHLSTEIRYLSKLLGISEDSALVSYGVLMEYYEYSDINTYFISPERVLANLYLDDFDLLQMTEEIRSLEQRNILKIFPRHFGFIESIKKLDLRAMQYFDLEEHCAQIFLNNFRFELTEEFIEKIRNL